MEEYRKDDVLLDKKMDFESQPGRDLMLGRYEQDSGWWDRTVNE